MLYKRENTKNWWIAFRAGKKIIRVSSETPDKKKAAAIEKTLLLARRKEMPGAALHSLIDSLLGGSKGEKKEQNTPIETIFEIYEQLIKAKNKKLCDRELQSRRGIVNRLLKWIKANRPDVSAVEHIDRLLAMSFAKSLEKTGVKTKTRASIISSLSTIWNGLSTIRDGILNPWRAVAPEVTDSERGKPFSREQAEAVIRAADGTGHGWGLACRIALYTGLRYGDIIHLTWDSVNIEERIISVTPRKTKRHNINIRIPIAKELVFYLQNQKKEEKYIFPEFLRFYPKIYLPHPFRLVLEKAKVDASEYTFHSWRHTFRTRLAEAGVSDDIARRLGGWTNMEMSMHYAHGGREDEMRSAVDGI